MIYLIAFAAVYYLIGVVGSFKIGMRAAQGTVSPLLMAPICIFWPVMLLWTYIKEASS